MNPLLGVKRLSSGLGRSYVRSPYGDLPCETGAGAKQPGCRKIGDWSEPAAQLGHWSDRQRRNGMYSGLRVVGTLKGKLLFDRAPRPREYFFRAANILARQCLVSKSVSRACAEGPGRTETHLERWVCFPRMRGRTDRNASAIESEPVFPAHVRKDPCTPRKNEHHVSKCFPRMCGMTVRMI